MYKDQLIRNFNPRRACEIEMQAKAQEKYYALLRAHYRNQSAGAREINPWKQTAFDFRAILSTIFG